MGLNQRMKPRIYKYRGSKPKELCRPWRLRIMGHVKAKLATWEDAVEALADYLAWGQEFLS